MPGRVPGGFLLHPARILSGTPSPSCAAKRAAIFGALLREEILEEVGHAQWVFTIPKLLRPYFLHHRELLGRLSRAAFKTAHELIAQASDKEASVRPGVVAVVQTATDLLEWSPHVHALVSRGGWDREGAWVPVPFVDARAAELLFRHKVITLLRAEAPFDPMDFLARLLMHIPQPKLHTVRYYCEYSSVAQARRLAEAREEPSSATTVLPSTAERRRLRRAWAHMIRRIYEVDPLICRCGAQMRILSGPPRPSSRTPELSPRSADTSPRRPRPASGLPRRPQLSPRDSSDGQGPQSW